MMYSNIKHKITSKEIEINITTDNKSEQVCFVRLWKKNQAYSEILVTC